MSENEELYGGLSGCQLDAEIFDLGEGVTLSKTFAHLMAPFLMAFAPSGPSGYHPAPWSAAEGGWGFDVHVQVHVPANFSLSHWTDHQDVIWWITALLRLAQVPFVTVPVISNAAFATVPELDKQPRLRPFEIVPRITGPANDGNHVLQSKDLAWVRDHWVQGGELMSKNPKLDTAFRAFDSATVRGKTSLSLLALWGGLEQLFSPSPAELRFRVSAMIASFLAPMGEERLALYKRVLKLYDARSTAAHTASDADLQPLVETYVLMRNALVKIIDENGVPTRDDLEALLFGCT